MRRYRMLLSACLLAVFAVGAAWSQEEPYPNVEWRDLFNGQDLTGWTLAELNGKAKYEVKDGAVVGTTVAKTPNTFLRTDRIYGNFVLEYEFKVDPKMNSGVQIRSWGWPEHNKGRFHGYQIEIDPSARAWTAGVYDEARRAWIFNLKDKPEAGKAFKQNEWNKIRVSFVGDHLQTWINGVAAADLHDTFTPAGYIALQVHQGAPDHQIMWRNIRIKDLDRANRGERGPVGAWKGATSNASKGIYAQVEQAGDGLTARLFDAPEMSGTPLAELKGKAGEDRVVKLEGGDWSGEIRRGVFTGKGKAKQVAIKGGKAEPTDKEIPVSFMMMKGSFQPKQ